MMIESVGGAGVALPRRPSPVRLEDYDAQIIAEFKRIYPVGRVPDSVFHAALRLLSLRGLWAAYDQVAADDASERFATRALRALDVHPIVAARELARVPATGPLVIVANHATGALDSFAVESVLCGVRSDLRVLANDSVGQFPAYRATAFPVAVLRKNPLASRRGIRLATDWVRQGGSLMIFPAGEMSLYSIRERRIKDRAWNPNIARLIDLIARDRPDLQVLPVRVTARNRTLFYAIGALHPTAAVMLVPRELLASQRRPVRVQIGDAFPAVELDALTSPAERIAEIRRRVATLGPV